MKFGSRDVILLLPALVVGAFLRLYSLSDQILLDDEWHAPNYVIGKSYGELLGVAPGIGATSAPMNFFTSLLLNTAGWNELLLRLPSILAGLFSLVALPLLAWSIFGRRIAFIFSLLLAISPFLVFYSRVARPYAVMVLLGATSIMAFWKCALTGGPARRRWAVLSVITGVAAIWFHVFAAIGVLAPITWGICYSFLALRQSRVQRFRKKPGSRATANLQNSLGFHAEGTADSAKHCAPTLKYFGMLFIVILVPSLLLLIPALLKSHDTGLLTSAARGRLELASLAGVAEIIFGSAQATLLVVLSVLAVTGVGHLFWKWPIVAGGILSTLAAHLLVFAFVRPRDIQVSIVICRYAILVLPILMVAVACGLQALAEAAKRVRASSETAFFYGTGTLICGALFVSGPLPRIYKGENNFTNHSAFQESYQLRAADGFYDSQFEPSPFRVTLKDVSAFYPKLARTAEIKTLIEYPMALGDHINLLYFYQQIHGKRVKIGYVPKASSSKPAGESQQKQGTQSGREFIWGNDTPDTVLRKVTDKKKLRFDNMVDLTDIEDVRASGADLVILHKDLLNEWSARHRRSRTTRGVSLVARNYLIWFGPPVFEDDQLIVYELKLGRKSGAKVN